jgi:class 3 adenylate cyclase
MTKLSDWIRKIRTAEKSGDLVVAYDLAAQGLTEHPESVDMGYLATRVLARSGATAQAAALYKRFGLDRKPETDFASLGARIAKDRALATSANRRTVLRAAAAKYAQVYTQTRDHYPAVNAASLYLLAGDHKRAHTYARRALDASSRASAHTSLDRYYCFASQAEAALICRDRETALQALHEAARHLRGDFDAAAATRKQLRLVCRAVAIDPDILDIIRPPTVLHYYGAETTKQGQGHWLDRQRERKVINEIVDYLLQRKVGYAYGSLAAVGELICAEACLQANVALHVVLPFDKDEFVETMVRAAGPNWVRRFENCLRCANSVTFATTDSYQEDDQLFTYACRLGMGMAVIRARHLDTAVSHLKLQAHSRERDPAGYAAAHRLWHSQGRTSHLFALRDSSATPRRVHKSPVAAGLKRTPTRVSRALLFGDVKEFSRTPDHLNPAFQQHFMGTIAAVLYRYRRHVRYRNSWGDAIYVVMDEPVIAAECSLAIQKALGNAKLARYGLSTELALRLAVHFGPVYEGRDPIRDEPMFYGAPTTLVARMEVITPPGQVYATEAMAAAIALADTSYLRAEYVGYVPMEKGFGCRRMYSLKVNEPASAASLGNALMRT